MQSAYELNLIAADLRGSGLVHVITVQRQPLGRMN